MSRRLRTEGRSEECAERNAGPCTPLFFRRLLGANRSINSPTTKERRTHIMREGEYVDSLIREYESLLTKKTLKKTEGEYDESEVLKELSVSADWSIAAAREMLKLTENYGAFI